VPFGLVLLDRLLKTPRENSFNTCEKMLHTFIRLSLLLAELVLRRNPIQPVRGLNLLTRDDNLGIGQWLGREFGQQ
jgi:hypothetical protein